MILIYLFFLTIKTVCITLGVYFATRLSILKIADTYSNLWIALGYLFSFSYQVVGIRRLIYLFIAHDFVRLTDLYGTPSAVIAQVLAAASFICFFVGTIRRYKFNKLNLPI